jgi:hypothetical protein
MKKFIKLSALLVLTRAADLYTTYLSTPDLKYEFNPLVSKLGLGWTGLILAQIAFLVFIIYALWVYCFKNVETLSIKEGLSLKEFVSLFYFGNTTSFSKIFYKLPTNKDSLLYSVGYVATYSLIIISIIVSSSTYLLVKNDNYKNFYNNNKLWNYLYLLGVCLIIYYSIKFFKNELKRRSNSNQTTANKSIAASRADTGQHQQ